MVFLNLSCNFTPIACHFSFPLKSETEILLFAFVIFHEKTIEEIGENVARVMKFLNSTNLLKLREKSYIINIKRTMSKNILKYLKRVNVSGHCFHILRNHSFESNENYNCTHGVYEEIGKEEIFKPFPVSIGIE